MIQILYTYIIYIFTGFKKASPLKQKAKIRLLCIKLLHLLANQVLTLINLDLEDILYIHMLTLYTLLHSSTTFSMARMQMG